MDRKVLIAFLIALLLIIVVGFVALNYVSDDGIIDFKDTDKANDTVLSSQNLTNDAESIINATNITIDNVTDEVNDTNDTNDTSEIDEGDILHKQTFTVSENDTAQNKGMEPGTYVMYYTDNDGVIKIEKVA